MTVVITPLELDFLWEALHAGEAPYPLEVRSHGATMDERAALRRQVHEGLRERGMLGLTGRLDTRTEDWLGALALPQVSIDLVFLPDLSAEPVRALAALGSGVAVLATQDARALTLRQIDRGALISTIVGLLPPTPRGTEPSISLPAEEFAMAGRAAAPSARTSEVETRQALARLTGQPNLRGGQIAVNTRSPMGVRRRSPVLAWFDNASGRYLGQVKTARDGRRWTTVAPADPATLRARLTEMLTAVIDDPR
jgi:hypothetical protein